VSKTSRSIFDALRLTLRAQPRSGNFKFGHDRQDVMVQFQFSVGRAPVAP